MNRREFVQATLIGGSAASALRASLAPRSDAGDAAAVPVAKLFPTELPELQWQEFRAAGFEQPVAGAIFDPSKPPCCGVPLGGISTGCIDLDVKGVYGFNSIFNGWSNWPHEIAVEGSRMARKPPTLQPLLGLAVGGETWVLTTEEILKGGDIAYCRDPNFKLSRFNPHVKTLPLQGVRAAKEIHYWGHYPIADLEFEIDAPVSVGLRAWSPFIPGDTAASNIPATVFEVHLRNTSEAAQKGTLAFNFPGPDAQEALSTEFTRQEINEDLRGVFVASQGGVNYLLGVMGQENLRLGSGLNSSATAWSKIATELPQPSLREWDGLRVYTDPSSSASVDFSRRGQHSGSINQSDGTRKCFRSRHGEDGCMVVLDYTTFHPRIVSRLVKYDVPLDIDIYAYLAKLYFHKKDVDETDIKNSKHLTFRQFYGGIEDKYLHIKYLASIKDYIDEQWKFFNAHGYVLTPFFKRKITSKHLVDPDPPKVFNYILQATEGELSIPKVKAVLNYLMPKKTRAVLYTYDAVLYDFYKPEGMQTIQELRQIMSFDGKFPMKLYMGDTYDDVKLVSV